MKVRDVMSHGVLSVAPTTPVKEVARLMATSGVSGVPVVDDSGTIVGVVSEADFLIKETGITRAANGLERVLGRPIGSTDARSKAEAVTAAELMTAPAITIGPDATLTEAARVMVEQRINRLPVERAGQLIGIVSRADLVRAYLRPDEELLRVINEELIRSTLWVDPSLLDVRVVHGVVHLAGTLDHRSTATWLVALIRGLEGVVQVDDSGLHWATDDRRLRLPEEDAVARGVLR
jgi:CBS domain-containing protein